MSDKESDDSEHINIMVTKVCGGRLNFKISRKAKLKEMMDKYCDHLGVSSSEVAFVYAIHRINGEDTIESLDMQKGDVIQVFRISELIRIKVTKSDGVSAHFCVKRENKLKKLMDTYCKSYGIPSYKAVFVYGGFLINGEYTAESLNMKEGDVIRFYLKSDLINISVTNLDEVRTPFCMPRRMKLKKVMDLYCEESNISRGQGHFLYDDSIVLDDDTPQSLDMNEEDTIRYVLVYQ